MKKNKNFISRLFSSNIFLLIISFFLAFVSWITVSFVADTNDNPTTIDNVPVTISLPESEFKYQAFVANKYNQDDSGNPLVSVKIKGNSIVAGSLKAENINATGSISINSVLTPQEYTLSITCKRVGASKNYDIVETTPSTIPIYVDEEDSDEFEIVNACTFKTKDDSSSTYPDLTLSQSKVNVSGPKTLIDKIASVEVEGVISEEGTEQKELIYLDSNNQPIEGSGYFTASFDKVDVTAKLLSKTKVTLGVKTANKPEGVVAAPVITPSAVWIVGEKEELDKLKGKLMFKDTLDYANLKNENYKEEYTITPPDNCKIIPDENEKAAPTKATVSLDLGLYSKTTITKKINYEKDGYNFAFSPGDITITLYGNKDELSDITSDDISLTFEENFMKKVAELKTGESLSRQNVKLILKLSDDYSESWIYGQYMLDQIDVVKK